MTNLTTDGRFVILAYDYIEGDHSPKCLKGFAGVVCALHIIHEHGYVHGDVRACNIIFSKDSSFLIDYDLAMQEGERYPVGFVHHNHEKHTDARAGHPMRKVHDRFTLGVIIEQVNHEKAYAISARVTNPAVSLDRIATELDGLA